jgi:RNA polymerase sigma-70 factor (ECF subfamily)
MARSCPSGMSAVRSLPGVNRTSPKRPNRSRLTRTGHSAALSRNHSKPPRPFKSANIGYLIYRKAPCLVYCQNFIMYAEPDPFRTLYDANHDRVHRLLERLVGPQEAEDLTQIVFAKATRALPQFRGDAQASTWLYRIAANVAFDWLRSRSAREAKLTVHLPEALDDATSQASASVAFLDIQSSPEQNLARKDMRECIRGEIGQLPEGNREVLILGELGGLTDDEVAQTLGISRANAKVRLHRARAKLKRAIEARCDFYRTELSCAPSSPACCPPAALPDGTQSDH